MTFRLKYLLPLLSLLLVACGGSGDGSADPTGSIRVVIPKTSIGGEKDSQFIQVYASGSWSLSADASDVKFSKPSGSGDTEGIAMSWGANPQETERIITVTGKSGGASSIVKLTQAGKPKEAPKATVTTGSADGLTVSEATLHGSYTGANGEIREAGFEWGMTQELGETLQASQTPSGASGSFEAALDGLGDGKTYYYKAQIVGTAEGRTLRSKKSKALKISACHFTAKYKVKCLTLAGTERSANKKEILLQLSNGNKYNGQTVIKPAEGIYNCTTSKGEPHSYGFHFTKYSTDGKNWHPIPSKGVALPKKKALYLKGDILKGDQKEIVFCGTGGTSSLITSEEEEIFDYSGPGVGWTLTTLNLTKGTGKALEMADY